ncbi:MAG: sulfite reductase subunit alpha [Fibrobacterota bacterium]|nr:sulfite reductase subunit alpha [Fibrobacterota bacterium]
MSPNSPVLPESAPFSVDQRMWLNGFLAGLSNPGLGGSSAAMIPAIAASAVPAIPVLVLFGSQSGTSEGLAQSFAENLKASIFAGGAARVEPRVMGMERFKEIQWSSETAVLMLTSTWGDGDMPDNATAFWDWLKGHDTPTLSNLGFAVLGLGDRNYSRFCQAGKNLDGRFAELGAKRLLPFCECDTDYEAKTEAWMIQTTTALDALVAALPAVKSGKVSATFLNGSAAVNGTAKGVSVNGSHGLNGHADASAVKIAAASSASAAPAADKTASPYNRKNPFHASLIENHPLNAKGSAKDTRHFAISLLGSGLEYRVGDALGIIPRNCYELVDRIILTLNYLGNEKILLDGNEENVLRAALLSKLDLRRGSEQLLRTMLETTRNQSERRRLSDILEGDGSKAKTYLMKHDLLDVLEAFPHTRLDAQQLSATLSKLAPRLYSISSSPKENPGEVHLTVGVVRYSTLNRLRRGVASTFLAERVPLGMTLPIFVQPAAHFAPPSVPGTPIIMVGPGTGIAPFRAFLQERRHLGDPGKNWLFFGDQRRQYDFLYSEEFVAMHSSGFLTNMDLAFSRDQEEKVYVQTRMLEKSRELFAWLEAGAHFYVCGDAKRMAKDVDEALQQVIAKEGGKTPEVVRAYLENLKAQKRYQRDVY